MLYFLGYNVVVVVVVVVAVVTTTNVITTTAVTVTSLITMIRLRYRSHIFIHTLCLIDSFNCRNFHSQETNETFLTEFHTSSNLQ